MCVFSVVLICVLLHTEGFVFFQAEDGIRDLVRSRGLGDVYKRQSSTSETGSSRRSPSASERIPCSRRAPTAYIGQALSLIHI